MPDSQQDQRQLLAYAEDLAKVYESEKQKRAQLEFENNKLRATIDGINDGIVTLDPELIITDANQAFSNLVNIPLDKLRTKSLPVIVSQLGWEQVIEGLDNVEGSDEKLIDLDGNRRRYYRIGRTLIKDSNNSGKGWVLTFHDETKRQRNEILKDEFLSLVSHEIRTPLNAILGFSSILEDSLRELLPEKDRQYFDIIKAGSERLLNTLQDMIDAADFAVDLPMDRVPFDLRESIHAAVPKVDFQINIDLPDSECEIHGYQSLVTGAVEHLLDNAIKFSPEKSEINVDLREVDTWWELTVTDHGEGIPPEHLERVFDRFHQAEGYQTRSHEGLGLGLYNVKKTVLLHGGEIHLESEPGAGTKVTLRFPKVPTAAEQLDLTEIEEMKAELDLMQAQNIAYAKDLAETYTARKKAVHKLEMTHSQLVRSDKLATLGQSVAGIAHEMANMLNPILGNAYLLKEQKANLTPDMERWIVSIDESARNASRTLRQILDFSRKGPENFAPVEPSPLIDQVLNFLEYRLRKGKVSVKKDYGQQPMAILANGKEIEQVITNLVINAIDAMDGGGELNISIREQPKRTDSKGGGSVEIRIADNGPGIPEEIRETIFEPFFSTKAEGQGTGLGLFISYGIIQKHGGILEVESEVGQGTTFSIRLPAPE